MEISDKELAECVGLWLAEGDNKTIKEVTFTNNCFELIIFFHTVMAKLFNGTDFRPRLYSYSKTKDNLNSLEGVKLNSYVDFRANKPYYIYRFASVKLFSQWKKMVTDILRNDLLLTHIIRGFFAGEGNIKVGVKCNRIIRIAQKKPVLFIEHYFSHLNINYVFNPKERSYCIWSRESWDKLAQINIADLHPEKKEKFWQVYSQFKEYHYSSGYLKNKIFNLLIKPYTAIQLSNSLNRTPARIFDVLSELKTENLVKYFKVGSKSYWIRIDQQIIIISSLKQKYLNLLTNYSKTADFAKNFDVCWKSAYHRLIELQKLGLVSYENGKWMKVSTEQKVVIG